MSRMKEVRSVFDNVQRTSYDYMKLLDKTYKDGYRVLIIDDKDGLNSILFAKYGAKVTMYESDIKYIKRGIVDETKVTLISNRKIGIV